MNEVPPYARMVAIGMAVAAALGLLANHFLDPAMSVARLMILALGPVALMLGLGGAVEPKILWAMGKYGEHLPLKYKLLGGVLGVAGLAITLLLVFFVYPLRMG